jgi:hypothetical protein
MNELAALLNVLPLAAVVGGVWYLAGRLGRMEAKLEALIRLERNQEKLEARLLDLERKVA